MNLVSTLVFVISFLLELQLQVYLTEREGHEANSLNKCS